MATIKEWLEGLHTVPGERKYGIEMKHGLPCKRENYLDYKTFKEENKEWLNEEVVDIIVRNMRIGDCWYTLFIYEE